MSALADRLLTTMSTHEIETVLWDALTDQTLESLVSELEARAAGLIAVCRPAEAQLVEFLIDRLHDCKSIFERVAARRGHAANNGTAEELITIPDERTALDARIFDLARRDEIDAALELVRRTGDTPIAPDEFPLAAAARHALADALRGFGRSREALDILLYNSTDGFPPGQFRDSARGKHSAARFSLAMASASSWWVMAASGSPVACRSRPNPCRASHS